MNQGKDGRLDVGDEMNFCSNLMKWLWNEQFPIFFSLFSLFSPLKTSPIFIRFWREIPDVLHVHIFPPSGALLAAAVLRSQRKGAYLRGVTSNPRALSTRGCWSHHRSGCPGRSGVGCRWLGWLIISSWVRVVRLGWKPKNAIEVAFWAQTKFFVSKFSIRLEKNELVVYVES